MKKLLVILGPTATGKTDLAISLAKTYNGELIACDSRQVYKGLDVGTGKLPGKSKKVEKGDGFWVINGIIIWLYDVVDPSTQYTLFNYVEDASKAIKYISEGQKLPILVGGTGLYLKGLLEGLSDMNAPVDNLLREELNDLSIDELKQRIGTLSPTTYSNLNNSEKNNKRRLIRKIEQVSMYPYINTNNQTAGLDSQFDVLKIGLTAPRPYLYDRINSRVFSWLKSGLVDEAEKLISRGVSINRLKELGLEFRCLVNYLEGSLSKEQLITCLQTTTRQYAKRQQTWFKKEKDVEWFDITDKDWLAKVDKLVGNWYNSSDD